MYKKAGAGRYHKCDGMSRERSLSTHHVGNGIKGMITPEIRPEIEPRNCDSADIKKADVSAIPAWVFKRGYKGRAYKPHMMDNKETRSKEIEACNILKKMPHAERVTISAVLNTRQKAKPLKRK